MVGGIFLNLFAMLDLLQLTERTQGIDFTLVIMIFIASSIYFAICACVGVFAKNRGRSFWLFFIISLLNPVLGFIIAALAGESSSFREERIRREVRIRMEEEQRYRQQYYENPPSNQSSL